MPTFDITEAFKGDLKRLTPQQKQAFKAAKDEIVAALKAKRSFPKRLRIKDVQDAPGVWEMTWQWPDGRATFQYGSPVLPGEVHIIWRRVGTHAIFAKP